MMFQENYINSLAVDNLAPCLAMSSTDTVFAIQDKQIIFFNVERFWFSVGF